MLSLIVGYNSFESIIQLMTVAIIFVFVLALTYFVTRWIGNYQKNNLLHSNIKVLETMKISNTKYIQIIKIGNKCFSIAVCKDSITYLQEINEDELEFKNTGETVNVSMDSFKEILDKCRNKKKWNR